MYRFLGKKKTLWFIISLAIMVPGIVALLLWKLPLGIDFRGGAEFQVKFDRVVTETELRDKFTGYQQARGATIAKLQDGTYSIRVLPISDEDRQGIVKNLTNDFGHFEEKQFKAVGPSISSALTKNAITAVILASALIIIYLAWSFRGVSYPVSSWRFGVIAVGALLHDLLITVGTFAILAHFFHFEIDASFITALLTVMGFSVHDTIVVFDRVRENLSRQKFSASDDFEAIVDQSLSQTLNRSLATSFTVILTLTALVVLGGASIRSFVATLLVGITVGTYSSIFTASPLLVVWQNRVLRKINRSGQLG